MELTRYLGAYLDSSLNFKEHIKTKCKAAMINLLRIRAARKFLTRKVCTEKVISWVISHLDYAHSLPVDSHKSVLINSNEYKIWHQK